MKEKNNMLHYLPNPGFCVENGVITQVNDAAAALLLNPGMEVAPLLRTGSEALESFRKGCLYLTLNLTPEGMDAFVTDWEDQLLFLLDDCPDKHLQSLALASRDLRSPLSGMMVSAARMGAISPVDPMRDDLNRLNRGLHQALRVLGNMSDACHCPDPERQQVVNLPALFDEMFQKAQSAAAAAGIALTYQGLDKEIFSLTDMELLERAVLNILSNAMKFTPQGGQIHAKLTRHKKFLQLQISDTGCGIDPEVLGTLFQRYRRQPGIEDSRFGIGLGMVIIRNAAACHGGTVLVDRSKEGGARVTMTLEIRKPKAGTLRSPQMRVDYAGEWNHILVELSDVLPAEFYRKEL